jgi:hypothetical protein
MKNLLWANAKIYVVVAFCSLFAGASFWHAAQTWAGSDARLMHGQIVSYEMVQVLPPTAVRSPRFAVEFLDRGQRITVHATSALEQPNRVPQNVTFWYSGDPTREVRLLETTNPTSVGLFFLGLAGVALAIAHGGRVWQWIRW